MLKAYRIRGSNFRERKLEAKNKSRNSAIELLTIVLMLMIINNIF